MSVERRFSEQDRENLRKDNERAGEYLSAALLEIATTLGGEEFATEIMELARIGGTAWPDPQALKIMNELYPSSAEQIMSRAEAIQEETHARELAQLEENRISES